MFRALRYALLLTTVSAPAMADMGSNLKQELEQFAASYAESYGKQDPAGLASKYTKDGMLVLQTGPQTDIAKAYENGFKAGFNHNKITINDAWPLGENIALGVGEFTISGKSEKDGSPLQVDGRWTAVYLKEGGQWKIRMLTAFPKAPPTK